MTAVDHDRLRNIKRFDQLVAYLRDELDWPIETDDFDDLTFDYDPEELGIDPKNAAKIEVIKQLRPLVNEQPWGIFWIKFKPKRLPVVALRRILGQLVTKKRASSNKTQQATWNLVDLMLISAIGEDDERQITFAHFANEPDRNLPTLRILGWDGADTILKLDHLDHELHEHLVWPELDTESDHKAWRDQWSSAFKLRHKEIINTSRELSIRLAELARNIRVRCNAALVLETEKGPLRTLMSSFKQALIHDLDEDDFADMYAQTIAYGLLSARVSRHVPGEAAALMPEDVSALVLPTNPFLKELMETFFQVSGRNGDKKTKRRTTPGIDFDELGINDVVDALKAANMDAVLRDFGDKNPQEDPVIHFYELFLKEYDAKKRMQRGVFYTPKPVVSYIVRSVHELLQTEFGLEDGLADTTTWGEMIERHSREGGNPVSPPSEGGDKGEGETLQLPLRKQRNPLAEDDEPDEYIDPNTPFVQILDPATGTATFLVEVIDIIHKTMVEKWKREDYMELEFPQLWNEYVPKHLLPRLHGYELMMAPYAIAHMKIGLKLFETGYTFGDNERARVYLTNALEPPQDFSDTFEQMAPALAHEAQAVNDVKRYQRFTVVIGNPPYAAVTSNRGKYITDLVRSDYYPRDGEREQNPKLLLDDYVKFIRLGHNVIQRCGYGILSYVTNHGFLDSPTFRTMRYSLLSTFRQVYISNLHGNTRKKEICPGGSADDNVFDIAQGVAISSLVRLPSSRNRSVQYFDFWGLRDAKLNALSSQSLYSVKLKEISPKSPSFFFIPFSTDLLAEYNQGWSLPEIFQISSTGVKTHRDHFVLDFEQSVIEERISRFRSSEVSDRDLRDEYKLNDTRDWKLSQRRRSLRREDKWEQYLTNCLVTPFNCRAYFHHPDVVELPRSQTTNPLLSESNVALLWTRPLSPSYDFSVFVTRHIPHQCAVGNKMAGAGATYLAPLYLNIPSEDSQLIQDPDPNSESTTALGMYHNLSVAGKKVFGDLHWIEPGCGDLKTTAGPDDVLHFIYAQLHAPIYRRRYQDHLRRDIPRVFSCLSFEVRQALCCHGENLIALHLLESSLLINLITTYTGPSNPEVEKVSFDCGAGFQPATQSNNEQTKANVLVSAGSEEAAGRMPAPQLGTVWLDKAKTCGFVGVPEEVWNFHIGGYQVCHKWLKDRQKKAARTPVPAAYSPPKTSPTTRK